jgi:hypothetical protein
MDSNSTWFHTMYGVHGLDDNPHAHPYAVPASLCNACSKDADCGGTGNKCTRLNTSEMYCTYLCTDDDGCPDGYACMPVAAGSTMSSKQCAPKNLTCEAPPPVPAGPAVVLNEVFASPKSENGDANGDGIAHYADDEFVELVNITDKEVDLTGWHLADSYMTRFTFASGTKLAPGKAILVFGGGTQTAFTSFEGVSVYVTGNLLGLNNTGDRVTFTDKMGDVVDEMSYGAEGGTGVSLVRAVDGDPLAGWGLHAGRNHSAGLRSDGSPF